MGIHRIPKGYPGFPWSLLGYSLAWQPVFIQVADIGGIYFISFFLFWVNWALYKVIASVIKHERYFKPDLLLATLVFTISICYGLFKVRDDGGATKSIRVGIIQPNIEQKIKWDEKYQNTTLEKILELTKKASTYNPFIIIWPETAIPFFFQENSILKQRMVKELNDLNSELIFGSPAFERVGKRTEYYNRVYLYSSARGLLDYYDKMHLVPFGEYVPLGDLIPLGSLGEGIGNFNHVGIRVGKQRLMILFK